MKAMNKTFKSYSDLRAEVKKEYPNASFAVVAAFGIGDRIYPEKECLGDCLGETNYTKNGRIKIVPPTY